MSFVASINYFIALFVDSVRQFRQGRLWLLLLAYFLLQWLVLYSHYKFYSPVFYWFIEPWLGQFGEQSAMGFIHYPGHFLTLPYFFGWAKFFLAIPLEGALLGTMAVLFYENYIGHKNLGRSTGKQLLFLWLQLTLAWAVINGLVLLVNGFLPELLDPVLQQAPRRIFVFRFLVQPFVYVLILSMFFFAIPYIAIYRVNVIRGLIRSLGILRRNPFTCFFLAGTILFVPIVFSFVMQNHSVLVEKFRPELVYWVLLIGIGADLIVYYFWMGTATRFLVDRD